MRESVILRMRYNYNNNYSDKIHKCKKSYLALLHEYLIKQLKDHNQIA